MPSLIVTLPEGKSGWSIALTSIATSTGCPTTEAAGSRATMVVVVPTLTW